jgi:SAM-dependent methyltransferase
MTDPHRDRHRAHFDPRQLAAELRDGGEVADHAFDRLYPAPLRTMSRVHWTPLAVARRAVELLAPLAGERMLDVGAGVGKVCLVGALRSPAHWTGLELRPALIRAAEQAARALGVAERTSFFATDMATFDWTGYDGVYLYNPFGEFLMPAAATSLRKVGPLAGEYSHAARVAQHRRLVAATEEKAWSLRPGARVVTFHGFGGVWPPCLDLVHREKISTDVLEVWVRGDAPHRPPPDPGVDPLVEGLRGRVR